MSTAVLVGDLHGVLLGLAGRLDDADLTTARALFAAGLASDAAAVVLDAGALLDVSEARTVAAFTPGTPRVGVVADVPGFRFEAPVVAPAADLGPELPGLVAELGIVGAWRALRIAPDSSQRVVHLFEVIGTPAPQQVTGRLQAWLVTAGEVDPQVEVVRRGSRPPAYHRALHAVGERLHPVARLRMARLFDGVDENGAGVFAPDHPRLTPEHARRILAHLRAAPIVLAGADDSVPGFRTDGTWVWCESTAWYLERHGLAPDPDLLRHLDAVPAPVTAVAPAVLERAVRVVFGEGD